MPVKKTGALLAMTLAATSMLSAADPRQAAPPPNTPSSDAAPRAVSVSSSVQGRCAQQVANGPVQPDGLAQVAHSAPGQIVAYCCAGAVRP